MEEKTSAPTDEEQILADFVAALEIEGPTAIDDFVARYPHLADEIHSLAAMGDQLHQARGTDLSSSSPEPPIPERLGEFRIVRRMARGGMGEIYEAVQDRLKRRVAVKVIRQGKISPDSRARFLREQTILGRLHQTHIVPIHTAGEHGPLQYFAMPYIEGATLSEVIAAAREAQSSNLGGKTPPLGVIAGKLAADSRQKAKPPARTAFSPLSPGGSALGQRAGGEGATDTGPPVAHAPGSPTPPLTTDHEQDAVHQQGAVRGSPDPALPSATTHHSRLTTHQPTTHLSMAYFRSAAQALADAAMALHHAYGVKILHRDVKPSNIMVDKTGQCWIIDFGLAGYVNQSRESALTEETIDFEPEPITSANVKGTPQYMAPEQFDGQSDVRTDVWGLGVTLYELLTLRRAFDGRSQREIFRKIVSEEPPPPRQLVADLPADLAAICRKAMYKDAARRYQTSEDFAADLTRWLRQEPVHARPTNALRRAWLWSKRNKGWAAAIGVAMAAFFCLGVIGFFYERAQTTAALEADRYHQREATIQKLERLRLTPHLSSQLNSRGWSDEAWDLAKRATELGVDDDLRNQAAATLIGLDARCSQHFPNMSASSVAFDAQGKRLLIGGASTYKHYDAEPAKVWDSETRAVMAVSNRMEAGPVAFSPDGTPWQLIGGEGASLQLWDVEKKVEIIRYDFDPNQPRVVRFGLDGHRFPVAMTGDASVVAAAGITDEGKAVMAVWQGKAGARMLDLPAEATCLAFSRDGQHLAAGDRSGKVTIWSVTGSQPLQPIPASKLTIRSLAFSPDGRRLAIGDSGGLIAVWRLDSQLLPLQCPGSSHDVFALTFSPDGSLLAGGGRGSAIWDAANGHLLLTLGVEDMVTGMAFSQDGNKLAVSSRTGFSPGGASVWDLDYGRGIRTLRGLSARVTQLRFSPDGRFLAALSHDWQIAIWNLETGRLHCIFDVPEGVVGNGGLAFSRDNARFAFSGGKLARLWDLKSREPISKWKLPQGQVDALAFNPEGKLLLFRMDTEGRRGCRIRSLIEPDKIEAIEIPELDQEITDANASPDGRYIVVETIIAGAKDGAGSRPRFIKAFDLLTGKKVWPPVGIGDVEGDYPKVDPTGKSFAFGVGPKVIVVEMLSGELHEHPDGAPNAWNKEFYIKEGSPLHVGGENFGFSLYRRGSSTPLLTLDIDTPCNSHPEFSPDGIHAVWPNPDGTVTVCDQEAVRRRLAEVGLGWEPICSAR
jgi:serine/threonine protein kinase/WD40 repeat protein